VVQRWACVTASPGSITAQRQSMLTFQLHALQVKHQGWIPQHVLLYDDSSSELMGCVPLYLKTHSYGEYVFDHSWASTHMRCGLPYYPKLQSCVPFTPVTGNRLLVKPGPNSAAVTKALAKGLLELTGMLIISIIIIITIT